VFAVVRIWQVDDISILQVLGLEKKLHPVIAALPADDVFRMEICNKQPLRIGQGYYVVAVPSGESSTVSPKLQNFLKQ
jgi:hypothetical protein